METWSPPVNVYSLSHQTHLMGQPVRRTNVHGRPAWVDSPWMERKISVTRSTLQESQISDFDLGFRRKKSFNCGLESKTRSDACQRPIAWSALADFAP